MKYNAPEFPRRIEIELASSCNLRCIYCPRHHVDNLNGFIDLDMFKKVISEIEEYPETVLVLHRRGESLLHPEFKEIFNAVAGKFKEVQMATNATLLTQDKYESLVKGLTFISFSIDTPQEFDKTRIPAKYKDVEKNILNFLEYNKGRVKTQVSMVKTSKTPQENCELFKKIWAGKVDRVRIYEEHSVGGVFGATHNPRDQRKPCVMPVYELLIYEDGTVGRCNHDWKGEPMGDIKANTIKEVWNSTRYNDLRNQHKNLKFTDKVCRDCDSWYPEIGKQDTGEVISNEA